MKRNLITLAVLGLLAVPGLLSVPAAANDGKVGFNKKRQVSFDSSDFEGFAIGEIVDWADGRSQVRIDFQIDTLDGTTGSAPEWGIEVYDTACGTRRSYPIYVGQAIDDPVYGVRLHDFVRPHLLGRAGRGSVILVHDGPTPTQHAIDAGHTGRHELACVDLGR